MRLNKGQGMIGEVLMGTAAIIIAITIFLIIESQGGGVMEQEISQEVDIRMSDIRTNTIMSNTLNGHLHILNSVNKGKYGNLSAYRIISYYFSTPGNKIYFDKDRNGIDKSTVRNDIKSYLEYKMDKRFIKKPQKNDYYLDIQNFNNPQKRPKKITINTTKGMRSPEFRGTIYLANQEKIYITLYKNGSNFYDADT